MAERGEGPEIPTLAAQLLARRLAAGTLVPGARTAFAELELANFEPLFASLAVRQHVEEQHCEPLYRQVMAADFDRLAAPVRTLHSLIGFGRAEGRGTVERGTSPLARLVGWMMGFPSGGEYPVTVRFAAKPGRERWTRQFGRHRFSSEMSRKGDLLVERFGPLRFRFALAAATNGSLAMRACGWTAFGVPMPRWLGPRVAASECADGGRFRFDVVVSLPLIGLIVGYKGWLKLVE